MNETAVQTGLQTIVRGVSGFADARITINDWTVLDEPVSGGPCVIIGNADNPDSRMDSSDSQDTYAVPLILVEPFTGDWKESLDNFRDHREALINIFNVADNTARSVGGIEGTDVRRIYADGPITEYYDKLQDPRTNADALPIFLVQALLIEVEEF